VYKIVSIGKKDAFYKWRGNLLGLTGEFDPEFITKLGRGWYFGWFVLSEPISFGAGIHMNSLFFAEIRVKKI
jgi:hypothetical protein